MFYILEGNEPKKVENREKWCEWLSSADRTVKVTNIEVTEENRFELKEPKLGIITVSTIFLGIDHAYFKGQKPLLFESMIFGGKHDGEMERYNTWDEALAGHQGFIDIFRIKK